MSLDSGLPLPLQVSRLHFRESKQLLSAEKEHMVLRLEYFVEGNTIIGKSTRDSQTSTAEWLTDFRSNYRVSGIFMSK